MKRKNIELSIIIVHFNTWELTSRCIDSVIDSMEKNDQWEIIVVNNGSTDNSGELLVEMAKKNRYADIVDVINSDKNGGFAYGNNIGINASSGAYVLLLNSDTEVKKQAIRQTLSLFENPTIGAATCRLVLLNGEIDPACHRGFPTPWAAWSYFIGFEKLFPHTTIFSQYHQGYKDLTTVHEIDAPSGAFFLTRKKVIEEIGLLDEDFFMYGEDLDWSYRMKKKGWKIMYTPKGEVLHKKKQSGRESQDKSLKKKITIFFYQTMQLFYKKHYMQIYPRLITTMILSILDVRIFFVKHFGL